MRSSGWATRQWPRPLRLTSYMAWSARCSTVSMSSPRRGPAGGDADRQGQLHAACPRSARRARAARRCAGARRARRRRGRRRRRATWRIRRRPAGPPGRSAAPCRAAALAAMHSAVSPASWPRRSLSCLKWSRSTNISVPGRPSRSSRSSRRAISSMKARRLSRPVSGSVRACRAISRWMLSWSRITRMMPVGRGGQHALLVVPVAAAGRAPQRQAGLLAEPRLAGADQHLAPVRRHRRPAARRRRSAAGCSGGVQHRIAARRRSGRARPGGCRRPARRAPPRPRRRARWSASSAPPPSSCGASTSWRMRHRMWSSTSPRRRAAAMAASWPSCSVVSWPMPRAPMMRPSASVSGAAAKARQMLLPSGRFSQARRRRTAPVGRNGLNPVVPPASASSSSRRLAEQRRRRPAQRRIGRDEHEPAPGIGLEGEVGGQGDQVAPAVAAVQQRAAQLLADRSRGIGGGAAARAQARRRAGRGCFRKGRISWTPRFMAGRNPRCGPRRGTTPRPWLAGAARRPARPSAGWAWPLGQRQVSDMGFQGPSAGRVNGGLSRPTSPGRSFLRRWHRAIDTTPAACAWSARITAAGLIERPAHRAGGELPPI